MVPKPFADGSIKPEALRLARGTSLKQSETNAKFPQPTKGVPQEMIRIAT